MTQHEQALCQRFLEAGAALCRARRIEFNRIGNDLVLSQQGLSEWNRVAERAECCLRTTLVFSPRRLMEEGTLGANTQIEQDGRVMVELDPDAIRSGRLDDVSVHELGHANWPDNPYGFTAILSLDGSPTSPYAWTYGHEMRLDEPRQFARQIWAAAALLRKGRNAEDRAAFIDKMRFNFPVSYRLFQHWAFVAARAYSEAIEHPNESLKIEIVTPNLLEVTVYMGGDRAGQRAAAMTVEVPCDDSSLKSPEALSPGAREELATKAQRGAIERLGMQFTIATQCLRSLQELGQVLDQPNVQEQPIPVIEAAKRLIRLQDRLENEYRSLPKLELTAAQVVHASTEAVGWT